MNQRAERADTQAAFDFLPSEMRHRLRFGGAARANHADFMAQSRAIDHQTVHLGSRIAASRMREVLRSVPTEMAAPGMATPGMATPGMATPGMATPGPTAQELSRQREALREIGTVVFYFRDKSELPEEIHPQTQRLHPRPLPARYYDSAQRALD